MLGAAGDLTKRKLIPALYNLAKSDLLPRNFAIIGISLQDSNDEAFRRGNPDRCSTRAGNSSRTSACGRRSCEAAHAESHTANYSREDSSRRQRHSSFTDGCGASTGCASDYSSASSAGCQSAANCAAGCSGLPRPVERFNSVVRSAAEE